MINILHFFKKKKIIKKETFSFKLLIWILFAIISHILIFAHYEKVSYFDALWVTMTTIFTVGYGDLFAKTMEARIATMVLLYGGGVFIIAKVTSDWFEVLSVQLDKKLKGTWRYKMNEHIVIINHPHHNPTIFLNGLISELSKDSHFTQKEIILVSEMDELPPELNDQSIKWVKGSISDYNILKKADVEHADAIFILASSATDHNFDSYALDIIDNLRQHNVKSYIISECVKSENKHRMMKNGADAVIKVMHGYPSVAARALTVKGSQEVMENLFSEDNEECIRLNITNPQSKTWKEIVLYCIEKDIGTPIACLTDNGKILTSPLGKTLTPKALFVIAHSTIGKNSIEMTWQ